MKKKHTYKLNKFCYINSAVYTTILMKGTTWKEGKDNNVEHLQTRKQCSTSVGYLRF